MLMSHMNRTISMYGLERSDFEMVLVTRGGFTQNDIVEKENKGILEDARAEGLSSKRIKQLLVEKVDLNEQWIWSSVESTHDRPCYSLFCYRIYPHRFDKLFPKS